MSVRLTDVERNRPKKRSREEERVAVLPLVSLLPSHSVSLLSVCLFLIPVPLSLFKGSVKREKKVHLILCRRENPRLDVVRGKETRSLSLFLLYFFSSLFSRRRHLVFFSFPRGQYFLKGPLLSSSLLFFPSFYLPQPRKVCVVPSN